MSNDWNKNRVREFEPRRAKLEPSVRIRHFFVKKRGQMASFFDYIPGILKAPGSACGALVGSEVVAATGSVAGVGAAGSIGAAGVG